jgi:hypothetical protein
MACDASQYVQYGCGLFAPPTWTNFDASPTLRLQRLPVLGGMLTRGGPIFPPNVRYGDVVRGLPVAPASCKAVYCSHVLEHLSLEDCRTALRNTYQHLVPGGIFRFVLPDLERLARDYVAAGDDPGASVTFMQNALLGAERRPRGAGAFLRNWLGNAAHQWMWDYKSLAAELRNAGFREVRRAQYHDSADPRFRDVEDEGRWTGQLGIECMRPA